MTSRNRMFNCKNPYQGESKKVLCVCSAGLLRSPTTANVLHTDYGYNTRAVGIDKGHALIPLDEVHIEWADEIVCMNGDMALTLAGMATSTPVYNLNIPDMFAYMDDKLQLMISESYEEILNEEHT